MGVMRRVVGFDASDLAGESAFWAGMLDGRVLADDGFHSVFDAEDRWVIGVQLAPNHLPPDWPDGNPQQVHMDLLVDDALAGHTKAVTLGARLLREPLISEHPKATRSTRTLQVTHFVSAGVTPTTMQFATTFARPPRHSAEMPIGTG